MIHHVYVVEVVGFGRFHLRTKILSGNYPDSTVASRSTPSKVIPELVKQKDRQIALELQSSFNKLPVSRDSKGEGTEDD